MIHDAAHCLDYREGVCPVECYRAQLVIDLYDKLDSFSGVPITWSNFAKTKHCPLKERIDTVI